VANVKNVANVLSQSGSWQISKSRFVFPGWVKRKNAINFYWDSAPSLLLARTPTTENAEQTTDNQWYIETPAVVGVLANNNGEARYHAKSDGFTFDTTPT
jgi:hypothetical protein